MLKSILQIQLLEIFKMNKTLFIFFTMFCFLLRRSVTCYCRRRPQTLCRLESFGAYETASWKLRMGGRFWKRRGKSRFHSAVENTREPTVKGPINFCPFFEHRPIAPAAGRLVRSERARFPGKELWSSMPKSCD